MFRLQDRKKGIISAGVSRPWLVAALALLLGVAPALTAPAWAAPTPLQTLANAEQLLYGKTFDEPLLNRIERLENDIFGAPQNGPLFGRIDRIQAGLAIGSSSGPGLVTRLNALEWRWTARLTTGPLVPRLDNLETLLYGKPQDGSVVQRIDNLVASTWSGKLDTSTLQLPAGTLIKIKLLDGFDSQTSRPGDAVKYQVVQDVMVKGYVLIPAGSEAVGTIKEVRAAERLGQDGQVVVDFGAVPSLDGLPVPVQGSRKAAEENKSLTLAAGAGIVGAVITGGPVGLAAAFLVKGADVKVPAGTTMFIETKADISLTGVKP